MHHHKSGGPAPTAELATALAKQGRTTGEVCSLAIAAVPIVSGGGPALERATILSPASGRAGSTRGPLTARWVGASRAQGARGRVAFKLVSSRRGEGTQ